MSGDLKSLTDYLSFLHASGKAYSSINIQRSMLSTTLGPIDGFPIGQHPVIIKLLKGCYNRRPPAPRYSSTWDPNDVIRFIASMDENASLTIPILVGKLVTLFALASLLRVSELASITFSSVSFVGSSVRFALSKPRKAQRSGALQSFSLAACPDSSACPVSALRSYISRTEINRPQGQDGRLFISLISPYGAVTGNTIARWIKSFLKLAGIDTSVFSAHSTRGAASSLAIAKGLSVDTVLQAGHWSSHSTFSRFYNRQTNPTFSASVLSDA